MKHFETFFKIEETNLKRFETFLFKSVLNEFETLWNYRCEEINELLYAKQKNISYHRQSCNHRQYILIRSALKFLETASTALFNQKELINFLFLFFQFLSFGENVTFSVNCSCPFSRLLDKKSYNTFDF